MDATRIVPIWRGDTYARTVDGGVRRVKAPEDGLLVDLADRNVFLPLPAVMAAIARLTPRSAPRRATIPQWGRPDDPEEK